MLSRKDMLALSGLAYDAEEDACLFSSEKGVGAIGPVGDWITAVWPRDASFIGRKAEKSFKWTLLLLDSGVARPLCWRPGGDNGWAVFEALCGGNEFLCDPGDARGLVSGAG